MKKLLVLGITLAILTGIFRFFLGFFPWHLVAALDVATGLGAKLACSGYYLSGQSEPEIIEDLASYSPATRLVALDFSQTNRVSADLKGLSTSSATYRPRLGCTLDVGDTAKLDSIDVEDIQASAEPWPKGKVVDTIVFDVQQTLDDIVTSSNESGLNTRAMVVVKNGNIIAESYAQGADENTPLLGWSMGKSLTAIMVGRYDKLHRINSLGDKALFAAWQDQRKDISLENLLQMSSGLVFDETYAPGSDSTHMLFSAFSASDVALGSELGFAPASHFSYSSGTTNIIARWLHQQLGENTQKSMSFLNNELFAPAGMHTAVFETDPSGVFVGSSYIYASGRDWARLGWLMANNGEINGHQLLEPTWVEQAAAINSSENYPAYGFQFWLNKKDEAGNDLHWPKLPKDAYFMMGNRKQAVMVVPSQQLVIVRLGWTSGQYPMEIQFNQIINAIADAN